MKTITLTIAERLLLPQLPFPQQGGKIEMLLVDSIVRRVEFTPEEISEFGLKDTDGTVSWSNGRDTEFEFTPEQIDTLKAAARRADEEKKVTRHNLSLIEKIDQIGNEPGHENDDA